MKEKVQDLRVTRTKRAIMAAFKNLVLETDLRHITVKNITEKAEINRKTFYLHYPHIEALIEEFQYELLSQLLEELKTPFQAKDGRKFFHDAFLFYTKEPALIYKLYSSYDYNQVLKSFLEKTKTPLDFETFVPGVMYPELAAAHMMSSIYSLICEWYSLGMPISPEKLADYGTELVYEGISSQVLHISERKIESETHGR